MKKITTPQLLEALVEQRDTGRKFGEILIARGFLTRTELDSALRTQGVTRLNDTRAGNSEHGVLAEQPRRRARLPAGARRAQGAPRT